MRRCLAASLAAFALLSLAASARAQQVTGAIKLGGSVMNFSGDTDTDFEPRAGWVGGVAVGYDFGNGLTLGTEFLYVTKGAYADGTVPVTVVVEDGPPVTTEVPIRAHWDLTYLEAPLLVQYRLEQRGTIHPKVFAGPQLAVSLDSKVRFRRKGTDATQTQTDDTIESMDYGVLAGAGVEVEFGTQRLSVEARYLFGQANVRQADPALHNTGVVFLLGVIF